MDPCRCESDMQCFSQLQRQTLLALHSVLQSLNTGQLGFVVQKISLCLHYHIFPLFSLENTHTYTITLSSFQFLDLNSYKATGYLHNHNLGGNKPENCLPVITWALETPCSWVSFLGNTYTKMYFLNSLKAQQCPFISLLVKTTVKIFINQDDSVYYAPHTFLISQLIKLSLLKQL